MNVDPDDSPRSDNPETPGKIREKRRAYITRRDFAGADLGDSIMTAIVIAPVALAPHISQPVRFTIQPVTRAECGGYWR
jgi:hypothetical protein